MSDDEHAIVSMGDGRTIRIEVDQTTKLIRTISTAADGTVTADRVYTVEEFQDLQAALSKAVRMATEGGMSGDDEIARES